MNRQQLASVLAQVRDGTLSPEDAASRIGDLPFVEVAAGTVIDHHRELRTGIPEIVYGASKTPEQIVTALRELARVSGGGLATRVDAGKATTVRSLLPEAQIDDTARTVLLGQRPARAAAARIAVVAAGTSDLPVAEEAAVVAEFLGAPVLRIYDVGVAGVHRLLARVADIRTADVVIAIAGMEAALPSVLGGLVDRPMIAVPTAVGYGVAIDGLIALGAMLTSCAPGITVVNIDNGVGAAVAAVRIARLAVPA
ncbi:MAG: nickel pincer cofactor biosynthesis protein LarB [Kofleriaceae bacterium]|nr:nickel pincer cofactor biosynthesis protein LarB [Kofleriaceae bacterium]